MTTLKLLPVNNKHGDGADNSVQQQTACSYSFVWAKGLKPTEILTEMLPVYGQKFTLCRWESTWHVYSIRSSLQIVERCGHPWSIWPTARASASAVVAPFELTPSEILDYLVTLCELNHVKFRWTEQYLRSTRAYSLIEWTCRFCLQCHCWLQQSAGPVASHRLSFFGL